MNLLKKNQIIFIGGPTASGKTSYASNLALKINGELINADSRQIYKYLNIGTNKGEIIKRKNINYINNVPIHIIDFLDPKDPYTVFDFKRDCEEKILKILTNKKIPIVVGGTGLYIDSIIKGYERKKFNCNIKRDDLEKMKKESLQSILKKNAPEIYEKINNSDKNNKRRLIRLIEKSESTESTVLKGNFDIQNYNYIFLYPKYNLADLFKKIEKRVEEMFDLSNKGNIVTETLNLLNDGYAKDLKPLQGTGYKETIMYLEKKVSLDECINLVKISHKKYAKRQITWFEGKGRKYNLKLVNFWLFD